MTETRSSSTDAASRKAGLPELADAARELHPTAAGDGLPELTVLRAFLDELWLHPEWTAAAIARAPEPSGSPLIENLMAAIAETLADRHGLRRPRWTESIPALAEPWELPGTTMMQDRWRRTTPPAFRVRGVWLGGRSLWRDRDGQAG